MKDRNHHSLNYSVSVILVVLLIPDLSCHFSEHLRGGVFFEYIELNFLFVVVVIIPEEGFRFRKLTS